MIELTAHERAFARALDRPDDHRWLWSTARDAVLRGLAEWRRERHGTAPLLNSGGDANARLAVVRLSLLADLAALVPEHSPVSLAGLLGIGDATPAGWVKAIEQAIEHATVVEQPSAEPTAPAPRNASIRSLEDALDWFAVDAAGGATDLRTIVFPSSGGSLELARLAPDAWSAPIDRRCAIRYSTPSGSVQQHRSPLLGEQDWAALNALVAGLHAVDRLVLEPAACGWARDGLRRAIVEVVRRGSVDCDGEVGPAMVVHVAEWLRAAAPGLPRLAGRRTWPDAFATVIEALDDYAGDGLEPFECAPSPGQWVERVEMPGSGRTRGVGQALDAAALPRTLLPAWPNRGRTQETVAVRFGRRVRHVPLSELRTPRRARLFGGAPSHPQRDGA